MSFQDIDIKPEYRSLLDNVVSDFYNPLLNKAVLYRRAVGFFSSSALIEITNGIQGLLQNDGRIELIASPRLTPEDIEAIEDGFERRNEIIEQSLLRELNEAKGKFEESRLNLLSNLIAAGKLEIKIAFLETNNAIGMFHEKMGLIYDRYDNIIAFTGSMNETANAFSHNYESIDVFKSWTTDSERVYAKQSAFNAMWNDYEPNITVKAFPNIEKEIIEKYKKEDITDFSKVVLAPKSNITKEVEEQEDIASGPRVPSYVDIRPYQSEAIESWENSGYVGIFDMATGTGKTYTGLAAIAHLYKKNKNRLAVIIVCPYQHLVEQWKDDIIAFGMKPIVCYSASKQKNWEDRLKTSIEGFVCGATDHFCAVTTNATFSGEFFQSQVSRLGKDSLIVADEAHNFGAEHFSLLLPWNIPNRLALSATIERHGDEEGTQRIYNYFGSKCIEYTLKQAIENEMLTRYFYYPITVSLNEEELDEYLTLTEKLSASMAKHSKEKKIKLTSYEKTLLIKRARIVAGAKEKIAVLRREIEPYKDKSNILVYCGATTYVDEKTASADESEQRQIEKVVDMLGNEFDMKVSPFTSEESAAEREQIKQAFQSGDALQALVAIRCLDEGVNIPSIKTAFILASSTNPKEYVQRRGRVLRKFQGKTKADIFDFITLPIPLDEVDKYSDAVIQSVQGLAKREITRMLDFAEIAENPMAVDQLISEIREKYKISLVDEGEAYDEYDD